MTDSSGWCALVTNMPVHVAAYVTNHSVTMVSLSQPVIGSVKEQDTFLHLPKETCQSGTILYIHLEFIIQTGETSLVANLFACYWMELRFQNPLTIISSTDMIPTFNFTQAFWDSHEHRYKVSLGQVEETVQLSKAALSTTRHGHPYWKLSQMICLIYT